MQMTWKITFKANVNLRVLYMGQLKLDCIQANVLHFPKPVCLGLAVLFTEGSFLVQQGQSRFSTLLRFILGRINLLWMRGQLVLLMPEIFILNTTPYLTPIPHHSQREWCTEWVKISQDLQMVLVSFFLGGGEEGTLRGHTFSYPPPTFKIGPLSQ